MTHPKDISISEYIYELPDSRIAKYPLPERNQSKCLIFNHGAISETTFGEILDFIPTESILVLNNTKVLQARLLFPRGEGLRPIEIFCLEPYQQSIENAMQSREELSYIAYVGGAKKWKSDQVLSILLDDQKILYAHKISTLEDGFVIRFSWNFDLPFSEVLELLGQTPIPPYLKRTAESSDKQRYQTVFAELSGSVAAPTAGLHFTEAMLKSLENKGVIIEKLTLHVGAGTFKPVTSNTMQEHEMHAEQLVVYKNLLETILNHPEKRIICVGTTSMRALESIFWMGNQLLNNVPNWQFVGQWTPYETALPADKNAVIQALLNYLEFEKLDCFFGKTQLIIAPSYPFKFVNQLFTNFHQPGSTLLLLVAAAIGQEWRRVYQYALDNQFRFLSYGDGSLLTISNSI